MESWEEKNWQMEEENHFSHIEKAIQTFKTDLELLALDKDGIDIFFSIPLSKYSEKHWN